MHTYLPTLCFNVTLSMSRRQWESWTYFYFIVLNMWAQHKLFDFHGPVTLLHLFFVPWFKKKILPWDGFKYAANNNYKLHTRNHYNYSVQGMRIFFFFWEEYCRIKVVTKCLSLRDLMRECMRSYQVAL